MDEKLTPSELTFSEVDLSNWERIDHVLAATGVESNFTCFPQLWTFAVKPQDKLFLCNFQGHDRLLLQRHRTATDGKPVNDVRLLFERGESDADLIEGVSQHFHPDYIAYNLIPEIKLPPNSQEKPLREELIISVPAVANLVEKQLARSYRRCQKKHPQLDFEEAKPEHRDKIMAFLDEWCADSSIKAHLGEKLNAENDRRFIREFLGNPKVKGGIVLDKEKIVGITFHTYHPSDPKSLAVKVICKNLRGYTKLGQYLMVEEAKQLQNEDYQEALMGGTENPTQAAFKEQFMAGGRKNSYYSCEVYRDSALLNLPVNYLRDLWV